MPNSKKSKSQIPNNKQKGFTLIELLVAMTIVAILALIGFTIYNSARIAANDTKRRQDIDAISTALEQHYNPYSHIFPELQDEWFQSSIPKDPNGSEYLGLPPTGGSSSYIVCAELEEGSGNACDVANGQPPCTPDVPPPYYCRKNLQEF